MTDTNTAATESSESSEGSQVQEQAPETKVVGKIGGKKKQGSGDLIMDIATEVEGLTKAQALNLAATLSENVETNQFKLGGVLNRIYEQSWFEGFESFDSYVFEKFGFQSRKARYLMDIYKGLVDKQIPWATVAPLGWTKLKDLVAVLTLENVDEWVAKALTLTVLELQAALKAGVSPGAAGSEKTTSEYTKLKFDVKTDQLETIQQAVNKAKAETATEFDAVALENICAGYLGGQSGAAATVADPAEALKALGWEAALQMYASIFPGVDLSVDAVEGDGTVAKAA